MLRIFINFVPFLIATASCIKETFLIATTPVPQNQIKEPQPSFKNPTSKSSLNIPSLGFQKILFINSCHSTKNCSKLMDLFFSSLPNTY
uniref:Uncharacterized protein n=1 Tax=Nelumbo nucifera TaxID=4432 RepID=A0A822YIR1_NELNU|nr:TPA_asm: hypothetical protein HUJ06_011321 [Nelumbo nucifera]